MFRIFCILMGYLVGCIQSAYLVGKIMHVDLRKCGSGNLGSTNALRVLGKRAGGITFACDILKSVVSFLLCRMLFPEAGLAAGIYGCAGAVLGHDFPFYLGFKGGKGIAAMIGMVLCLAFVSPVLAVVAYAVGILGIVFTKYVSVGSMLFSVVIPLLFYILHFSGEIVVVGIALGILALFRHKANIKRLLSGNENKLVTKK